MFFRFDEETKERIRDQFKHEKKLLEYAWEHILGNENAEGENKGLGILDFKTVLLSRIILDIVIQNVVMKSLEFIIALLSYETPLLMHKL